MSPHMRWAPRQRPRQRCPQRLAPPARLPANQLLVSFRNQTSHHLPGTQPRPGNSPPLGPEDTVPRPGQEAGGHRREGRRTHSPAGPGSQRCHPPDRDSHEGAAGTPGLLPSWAQGSHPGRPEITLSQFVLYNAAQEGTPVVA